MLTDERKTYILNKVKKEKTVSIKKLHEELGVSESTIRRNILELSREGKLIKVFGGAVALDETPVTEELSVQTKEMINVAEKRRIAEYAASLIVPEDYVYIDSGTTTQYMIEFINEKKATYVTNAVSHAKKLVKKGMRVFLIGGELKENTEAIVGADAILHVQKYHFTKGFFGTNGISHKLGFTTPDVREALIKRVAIENTQLGERYILADHDKFGLSSAVTFADFAGCVTITDSEPDALYKKDMELIVVGRKK